MIGLISLQSSLVAGAHIIYNPTIMDFKVQVIVLNKINLIAMHFNLVWVWILLQGGSINTQICHMSHPHTS